MSAQAGPPRRAVAATTVDGPPERRHASEGNAP
jgi:hypothetical protein